MWNAPVFMPLCFCAHYAFSPAAARGTPDMRATDASSYRHMNAIMSILVLVDRQANGPPGPVGRPGSLAPGAIPPRGSGRRASRSWPVELVVVLDSPTTREPTTREPTGPQSMCPDLPVLRGKMLGLAAASALAVQYQIWSGEQSLVEMFLPSSVSSIALERLDLDTIRAALDEGARWDRVFLTLASLLWFLLSWSVASLISGGSDAMLGLMWLCREQALASHGANEARAFWSPRRGMEGRRGGGEEGATTSVGLVARKSGPSADEGNGETWVADSRPVASL